MKIWINIYQYRQLGGLFTPDLEYRYELHEHTKIVPTSNQWKYFKNRPDISDRLSKLTEDELLKESEFHNFQVFADIHLC